MKILVTGATGFLGSHLVSRLAQNGDEVIALVRKTSNLDHLPKTGVNVVFGDLKEKDSIQRAVEGVDIVYHAGAAMQGDQEEYEQSTVRGTQWMLELAQAAGVKRFVHISSLVVYKVNGLKRNALVNEECPYEPVPERVGPYAYAKLEAEKLAFRFCEQGLPVVVVRPGIIYGTRGKIMFPHVGYFFKGKLFVIVGNGANLLPLTYIDNTVDAIIMASHSEKAIGQAYTIVDDEEITQKEYLNRYFQEMNSKVPVLAIPLSLFLLPVGLVEQLKSFGFLKNKHTPSKYGLYSKYHSLRYSAAKAREELNWQPKISLEEGLSRTFAWYKRISLAID